MGRIVRRKRRKAFLLVGARQTGKTFIVRQFAKNTFLYLAEINFLDNKDAAPILQSARSIDDFVSRLSLLTSSPIIPGKTLLFFDEIQEAPDLITAVKFLVEDGRFPVVLSESMLGTELKGYRSFPVGYVHIERMFPLDFEEFCWAQGVSRHHRHHVPLQRRLAARPQPAHAGGSRRQPHDHGILHRDASESRMDDQGNRLVSRRVRQHGENAYAARVRQARDREPPRTIPLHAAIDHAKGTAGTMPSSTRHRSCTRATRSRGCGIALIGVPAG